MPSHQEELEALRAAVATLSDQVALLTRRIYRLEHPGGEAQAEAAPVTALPPRPAVAAPAQCNLTQGLSITAIEMSILI